MVRLRSNRWYSGDNQHRIGRRVQDNSSGGRRLISLLFLLGLVLLLMQRASDPKVIRQAFDSLGVPLDREPAATSHPGAHPGAESFQPAAQDGFPATKPDSVWVATCQDLVARILETCSPSEINELAEFWFTPVSRSTDWKADEENKLDLYAWRDKAQQVIGPLRERLDGSEDDAMAWRDALDQFWAQWQVMLGGNSDSTEARTSPSPPVRQCDPVFGRQLSTSLDQRLVESLRSAAPWNPSERIAFGRLLQRGMNDDFSQAPDPALVTTHQLERSFNSYRGRWIRFRGSVRRVESVHRPHPLVDRDHYWVVWLKGADGSSQPVAVYTVHRLAVQLQKELENGQNPEVEIIALAGKRLAYASQSGVQVAPALFAGSIIQFAPDFIGTDRQSFGEMRWSMVSAAAVAVALSLLVVLPLWFSGRKSLRAKRCRWSSEAKLPLIAALWLTATANGPTLHAAPQAIPPWSQAEKEASSPGKIIQQRLAGIVDADIIASVEQLIGNQVAHPPDQLVKIFHTFNQAGWNRTWSMREPISGGQIFQMFPREIQGWVQSVQAIDLTEEQRLWFSVDSIRSIYKLQLDDSTTVFCLHIPTQWRGYSQLHQPVLIRGFALAALGEDIQKNSPDSPPALCILAQSPGWVFPKEGIEQTETLVPELSPRWLRLGAAGWDLSWRDVVEKNHQKPISSEETPALLHLITLVGRLDQNAGPEDMTDPVAPLQALREPIESMAAQVDWIVRLVSGSEVQLPPGSFPELTGTGTEAADQRLRPTRYYQFDGFVKLPGQKVNYQTADRRESIQFDGEYPVTILMQEGSEFILKDESGKNQPTWNIGKTARVGGRFYRLWSYRSERLSKADGDQRQVAPLIIAAKLEPASPPLNPQEPTGWFGYALTGLVSLIMAGILFSVLRDTWFPSRSSRRGSISDRGGR
jgi:hypothetical protein